MLQRVLLLLLLTRFPQLMCANAHFNRHQAGTSAAAATAANAYGNPAASSSWQPMSMHNNWIILQTAATRAPISHHALPYANSHAPSRTLSYAPLRTQQEQQHQQQRLPVNFYAYNHSAGNYHPPQLHSAPPTMTVPTAGVALKAVEPYVLAISDMRHRASSLSLVAATTSAPVRRQEFVPPLVFGSASKLSKDGSSHSFSAAKKPQPDAAQDIDSAEYNVAASAAAGPFNTADDEPAVAVEQGDDGANEILLSLEGALDKVKQFCEIAKHFISSDGDDDEIPLTHLNKAAVMLIGDSEASSGEVQGRTGISASALPSSTSLRRSSSTSFTAPPASATAAIGTGRKVKKLKKKFKKFLLPLLIAYKLKFLTLIPVLIGGLTLLVGTTGLAGFFFALFTAVMSLKSGGGTKSIIVKSAH